MPSLQEINDKLDQLLKYQKQQRIWGWIKMVIWLGAFIVLVGIPSYYAYDVFKNPGKYFDPSKLKQYQQQFLELQKGAEQILKQLQK